MRTKIKIQSATTFQCLWRTRIVKCKWNHAVNRESLTGRSRRHGYIRIECIPSCSLYPCKPARQETVWPCVSARGWKPRELKNLTARDREALIRDSVPLNETCEMGLDQRRFYLASIQRNLIQVQAQGQETRISR